MSPSERPGTTWFADVRPTGLRSAWGQHLARKDDRHADANRSAPEPGPPGVAADPGRLPGMPHAGVRVGAPAPVPDLRARGLLRLFAAPSRAGPRLRGRSPDRPVVRAGRGLALVLCRRNLRLRSPRRPPTSRGGTRG